MTIYLETDNKYTPRYNPKKWGRVKSAHPVSNRSDFGEVVVKVNDISIRPCYQHFPSMNSYIYHKKYFYLYQPGGVDQASATGRLSSRMSMKLNGLNNPNSK